MNMKESIVFSRLFIFLSIIDTKLDFQGEFSTDKKYDETKF